MLRVEGARYVVAELPRTRVRRQGARRQTQQRRLARAVRPDQGDALVATDLEVEPVVDDKVPVAARHLLEAQHRLARAHGAVETQAHGSLVDGGLQRAALGAQLVDGLLPALCLSGLGGLEAEALDELLHVPDLAVELGATRVALGEPGRLLLEVRRVVAAVGDQSRRLDLGDPCDVPVEEGPVMRDHHDSARVAL